MQEEKEDLVRVVGDSVHEAEDWEDEEEDLEDADNLEGFHADSEEGKSPEKNS